MQRTEIQYLSHTWNPVAMRCKPISAGCARCWHLPFARRHAANPTFRDEARRAYAGGRPWLNHGELEAPLRVRKPARIGVQFMGDMFADHIHIYMVKAVWEVMEACPRHVFIVLTKRAKRMRDILSMMRPPFKTLPNVWLGVSAEDQDAAELRVPDLLGTPAAHRWVSVEPMLGPVDMKCWLEAELRAFGGNGVNLFPSLDWVVCGAETGHRARPMAVEWAMRLIGQCSIAGVPCFGKVRSDGAPLYPREIPQ